MREKSGIGLSEPFLPTDEFLTTRKRKVNALAYDEVWTMIHCGGMPERSVNENYDWRMFYGSYVKTYIERDVGISPPTAERWLSILVTSNIVYLLKPYANNITKRTVKTPKLYFLGTGLAAYLTRWNTVDVGGLTPCAAHTVL